MTKFEDLSAKDQALVKVFEISLEYIKNSDKLYLEHLSVRERTIKELLNLKYEDEPPKFFKKMHKKWEDEIEDLESQLRDVYIKFEETMQEQYDFYQKLREA